MKISADCRLCRLTTFKMLLQTLLSFYRAAPTSDCAGVRWVAAAVSIKQLYRRINCAGTQDERRHHHCHQPLHQCPLLPWPLRYNTYNRLFFIDKSSATNAFSWYHGRKGEPKTNNSHIRTCHCFLSYIQIALSA